MALLNTLCNYVGLIDCIIILLVLDIQMAVGRVMIFSFADCIPRILVVIHVEREIFCQVVPLLLEDVTKTFHIHESNVLSADFLLTVVF